MKKHEVILKRQTVRTRFRNQDLDFMLNWSLGIADLLGMGPALVLSTAARVKHEKPKSWRAEFDATAARLLERAEAAELSEDPPRLTAEYYFGAAYAYRAALQLESPRSPAFLDRAAKMEKSFQQALARAGHPVESVEIPFEGKSLPGYLLRQGNGPRPLLVMVGGGDTFREDLWYFGGFPALERGWNALMVDLPGQGLAPARGLTFREDMGRPISASLDWALARLAPPSAIALYGVSGGGWFTAQAAATDPRIGAWIAATPIFDMAELFRKEFGAALKAPPFILELAASLAGGTNEAAKVNLEKYCWQFGAASFAECVAGAVERSPSVDLDAISCPCLFLVSEGESEELKRQTKVCAASLSRRGVPVKVRHFLAAEGADGHCQVNNLRLAQLAIFGWLEETFAGRR